MRQSQDTRKKYLDGNTCIETSAARQSETTEKQKTLRYQIRTKEKRGTLSVALDDAPRTKSAPWRGA